MTGRALYQLASRARRAAYFRALSARLGRYLALGGGAAVLCHAGLVFFGPRPLAREALLYAYSLGAGVPLALALAAAWLSVPGRLSVLRTIDRAVGSGDRLSSGLVFLQAVEREPAHRLQLRELAAFLSAQTFPLRQIFPLELRRVLRVAASLIVAAAALMLVEAGLRHWRDDADAETLLAETETRKQSLETIQQRLRKMQSNEAAERALSNLDEMREKLEEGELTKSEALEELEQSSYELDQLKRQLEAEAGLTPEVVEAFEPLTHDEMLETIAKLIKQRQLRPAANKLKNLAEKIEKNELRESRKRHLSQLLREASLKMKSVNPNLSDLLNQASLARLPEGLRELADKMLDLDGLLSQAGDISKILAELEFVKAQWLMGGKKGEKGEKGLALAGLQKLGDKAGKLGMLGGQGQGLMPGALAGGRNGNQSGMASPMPGGLFAGVGTSDAREEANRVAHSVKKLVANPKWSKQGASQVRTIRRLGAGQGRTSGDAQIVENIQKQLEDPLYREKIPLGRRWHVLRYCEAIRP